MLAVVFGGSSAPGAWANAIVRLAALGLIAVVLLRPNALARLKWPLTIVAGAILLIGLQLVPLPPGLWNALPGRALFTSLLDTTGLASHWRAMSLNPYATRGALLALLPPLAAFVAVAGLDQAARRSLTLILIGFGMIAFLLGLAQLAQGPASPLRLHPITNTSSSVGFFADRNHHAAFLYALIPLSAAWMIGFASRHHRNTIGAVAMILILVALLLGLGMSLSRAGVALGGVAFIASLGLGVGNQAIEKRYMAIGLGIVGLAAVALFVNFALFDFLARFEQDLGADSRVTIFDVTLAAGRAFQPLGSGFGTFVPIYQMFEPVNTLIPAYVNHAHNDYLEIWLEGGWPGVLLVAAVMIWIARAAWPWWRHAPSEIPIERAASISILLLLLHSAVEYPLRSVTMGVVFGALCGLLVPPPRRRHRHTSRRDHHAVRRTADEAPG